MPPIVCLHECIVLNCTNLLTVINLSIPGKMIRDNKVLTKLELKLCGLGPEGISEICDAIRMNTVLTSLDLSANTFNSQSITSLGKMFITSSGHGYMVCLSDN